MDHIILVQGLKIHCQVCAFFVFLLLSLSSPFLPSNQTEAETELKVPQNRKKPSASSFNNQRQKPNLSQILQIILY